MLPAVREYTVSLHAQTNKIVTDRLSHTCSQLYTDVATSRHTYLILLCLNECTYTQKHTLDSQTMKPNRGGGLPTLPSLLFYSLRSPLFVLPP